MGSIQPPPPAPILGVGIIGCGEITQVVHLPTIGFLSDLFRVVYLCDVSLDALHHCRSKVAGEPPSITKNARELCESPLVDVVLVATSDPFHTENALLALQHNKHVFVEKPLALNQRDIDLLLAAERKSRGSLMVGYMRRYAPALRDAIDEIGGMDKITFARVRDIIGPNRDFVNQSGTFPKKFTDLSAEDIANGERMSADAIHQALQVECNVPVNKQSTIMWRVLGGLGSHDLSVMREALGMPEKVLGASLGLPFWSAIFKFPGFSVVYESGIDNIPRFDCHIEVYSMDKSVRVQYDSPYIKGLPTTMHVRETTGNGSYRESTIRKTYEDNYTLEMKELYDMVTGGKQVKTSIQDAANDLKIFQMIMQKGEYV